MKNQLITDEQRSTWNTLYGCSFPEDRCTGKTTGAALAFIGQALQKPGLPIFLHDEHLEHLVLRIGHLIDQLGLQHLEVNRRNDTLNYNLYI